MNLNEYQKAAMRTATLNRPEIDILTNAVLGLTGESGEAADIVKKHLYQGHTLDAEALEDEIGDVLWYCALGATALGVDLDEVAQRNVDKLISRYPEGFEATRSVYRCEGEEDTYRLMAQLEETTKKAIKEMTPGKAREFRAKLSMYDGDGNLKKE